MSDIDTVVNCTCDDFDGLTKLCEYCENLYNEIDDYCADRIESVDYHKSAYLIFDDLINDHQHNLYFYCCDCEQILFRRDCATCCENSFINMVEFKELYDIFFSYFLSITNMSPIYKKVEDLAYFLISFGIFQKKYIAIINKVFKYDVQEKIHQELINHITQQVIDGEKTRLIIPLPIVGGHIQLFENIAEYANDASCEVIKKRKLISQP